MPIANLICQGIQFIGAFARIMHFFHGNCIDGINSILINKNDVASPHNSIQCRCAIIRMECTLDCSERLQWNVESQVIIRTIPKRINSGRVSQKTQQHHEAVYLEGTHQRTQIKLNYAIYTRSNTPMPFHATKHNFIQYFYYAHYEISDSPLRMHWMIGTNA